ncbi:MAG: ribosomal protein L7/L12 [Clostridia bacterium]|nr:ribosomal protein L7/L12 [Clostridia bacterium]
MPSGSLCFLVFYAGLGLAEAKALVDSAPAPIKEAVPTAEAEESLIFYEKLLVYFACFHPS